MNWITKFIKPKIKSLFEKKSSKTDGNLWTTCGCKNLIYKEDMEANQKVCPPTVKACYVWVVKVYDPYSTLSKHATRLSQCYMST